MVLYEKLDLDPKKWPSGYWDSARICEGCMRTWPNMVEFELSPCCECGTTISFEDHPELRWPEAFKELMNYRFENWLAAQEVPDVLEYV